MQLRARILSRERRVHAHDTIGAYTRNQEILHRDVRIGDYFARASRLGRGKRESSDRACKKKDVKTFACARSRVIEGSRRRTTWQTLGMQIRCVRIVETSLVGRLGEQILMRAVTDTGIENKDTGVPRFYLGTSPFPRRHHRNYGVIRLS